MTLYEKILKMYPTLTNADFDPVYGSIRLQNNSDGNGDYIFAWTNSNPQPTEAQLKEITQ